MERPKERLLLIVQKTLEQKGSKPEYFIMERDGTITSCNDIPHCPLRSADPLSYVRTTALTPEKLRSYFDLLETTIREKELMNKPNLIYNMDESGIPS